MSRRRLQLGVGVVVLLVTGFVLFLWLTSPAPGVTWENFRRLQKGMSASDVAALLGEPHDVQDTIKTWWGDEVYIFVIFNTDRVEYGEAWPNPPGQGVNIEYLGREGSLLDRIRRLLHW